jgi:hypothetical protein
MFGDGFEQSTILLTGPDGLNLGQAEESSGAGPEFHREALGFTPLMRAARLAGVSRRQGTITTRRDHDARPAPDLVERDFVADAPGTVSGWRT